MPERYRPAAPGGGATGAPAAGVPLVGVCSGGWFGLLSFCVTLRFCNVVPPSQHLEWDGHDNDQDEERLKRKAEKVCAEK
jgi:hypothetical protein